MHWGLTLCNPHQLQHNNPLTSLPLSSHLLLSDSGFHFSPQRGTMPDSLIKHSPRQDFHHPHQSSNSAQAAKSSLVCHQVRHPRGRISLGSFNDNQSKHAASAFSFKTNTLVSEAQVCHKQICIYLEYISAGLPLGRVSLLKSTGKTYNSVTCFAVAVEARVQSSEKGHKNDQRAGAPAKKG